MEYLNIQELVDAARAAGSRISDAVLADQAEELGESPAALLARMDENLRVMEKSVAAGQKEGLRSISGLTGGDGRRMMEYSARGESLMGGFLASAVAMGVGVAEYNAAMGEIVAAPTAGSCGIMPGCLIAMLRDREKPREAVVMSMFTASAVGMVVANRASIAGAAGGCQAECGTAAAMTAAALVELMGGTPGQCADAAAIALKNQLGLVCDPVAGLVEIPCIKRNAEGIVTAFCAAEMALAGVRSNIPVDEVIRAMKEVGDAMPSALKETACGGLAATPTGLRLKEQVFGIKS